MKHEKIFIFIVFCFLFIGCKSTRIPNNINAATETRNDIAELQSGQAESAAAAAEITSGTKQLAETVDRAKGTSDELADTIRTGTQSDIEFAEILREIYSQPAADPARPPGAN